MFPTIINLGDGIRRPVAKIDFLFSDDNDNYYELSFSKISYNIRGMLVKDVATNSGASCKVIDIYDRGIFTVVKVARPVDV